MGRTLGFLVAFTLVAVLAAGRPQARAQPSQVASSPLAGDADDASMDLPYRLAFGGRPTVSLTVNGFENLDFIVDTAASQSAMYAAAAARVGAAADPSRATRVFAINGVAQRPLARIDQMVVGSLVIEDIDVVALPDWPGGGEAPDGVLGLDVLADFIVVFDPGARSIALHAAATAPDFSARGWRSANIVADAFGLSSRPLFHMRAIVKRGPVPVLIDTGSEVSFANRSFYAQLRRRTVTITKDGRLADANLDDSDITTASFDRLRAGEVVWRRNRIFIGDAPVFADIGYRRQPFAIFGYDLLSTRPFAIDFKGRKIHFFGSE